MTCYNEGPYIGAAVRSVLDQTRADLIDKIVIADDGSEPDTIQTLKMIQAWDPRIEILFGPGGAGLPRQRNLAIERLSAEFFAILDGDDIWTLDKIETQLPLLMSDAGIGLVYGGYYTFPDQDLGKAQEAKLLDITSKADLTRTYFLNDPPIIPSTTIIRRATFERCGRFNAEIRVFEDTDFFIRMARISRFAMTSKPLLYKRNRGSSITGGRKDLMAHHALVAFKAAAVEPELMPLVTRRLAERARKLGNQRFLVGDYEDAARLTRLAVQLDASNLRAWASFLVAGGVLAKPAYRILRRKLKSRQAALGVEQP